MTEHQRIVEAIESSRVFSVCDRLVVWASSVVGQSRAGAMIVSGVARVNALSADLVRFGLGIVFVVAAITHVLVMLLIGPRESWLWPLLPLGGAAIGILLLVFSAVPQPGPPTE